MSPQSRRPPVPAQLDSRTRGLMEHNSAVRLSGEAERSQPHRIEVKDGS
jgi:hypothetical protein